MAHFWDRVELANPPPHIERKRREAVCEWVPCAGSKRKLDLSSEERALDEESGPSTKLFAVDDTVRDYVLDSNGFMRDPTLAQWGNTSAPVANTAEPISKTDDASEEECMAIDEGVVETGLPDCMVESLNEKNGGGYTHATMGNSIGKKSPQFSSVIFSNEVRNSMAKRPVDISAVLAQQMAKQATMAVVLWKPQLPSPLDGISLNSQPSPSPNSNQPISKLNAENTDLRIKNSNDDEMETTEGV